MKKIRIFLCVPVVTSSYLLADVKVLDDSELSLHLGQAGLTIDTKSISEIGDFEYIDNNLANFQNINVGGHGNDGSLASSFYTNRLDNLRVNISLTENISPSEDNSFIYGFSEFRDLANTYLANGNTTSTEEFQNLASGIDSKRNYLDVDDKKKYDERGLIIHYGYLDPWEKDGGVDAYAAGEGLSGKNFITASYEETESLVSRSVDFKYSINEIGISYRNNQLGTNSSGSINNVNALNSGSTSTRLMSNFSVQGYLGPHDLYIKEYNVNEDSTSLPINDNGITWNSYFKVTDLDVYLDVSGTQISDLEIHNNRGDLSGLNLSTTDNSVGNSSFGFAHAQREIYSVKNAVLADDDSTTKAKKKLKDGIAFNTRFKGDIDIKHLSFGDTGISVGKFFITDMYFNNRLTITPR
tara:strand:- start:43308 stop:44540 length:1233 start_codon:yes stop_codon:yes gene_type:complete